MTIEIDSIPGSPVIGALNGDITDLETDVIVNSANTEMVLGGRRSVAGRINQLTDGRLERILADPNEFPKPIRMGEICVTEGDVLPCNWIFHLSTHGTIEEMIEEANNLDIDEELPSKIHLILLDSIGRGIRNIISESERLEQRRISIPLIASGTLNMSKSLATEVLLGSITNALEEIDTRHLEELNIVTPERDTYDMIREYIGVFEDPDEEPDDGMILSINASRMMMNESREYLKDSIVVPESMDEIYDLKRRIDFLEEQRRDLKKENELLKRRLEILEGGSEKVGFTDNLPLPIAYAENIISSEMDPIRKRMLTINAIGIFTRFYSALLCSEYGAHGFPDEEVNKRISARFRSQSLTDGSWRWIAQEIAKSMKASGLAGSVIKEFPNHWIDEQGEWSPFTRSLKELNNLRNNAVHDALDTDSASAENWLEKVQPHLDEVRNSCTKLLCYELIFVESIEDFLNDDAGFVYSIRKLKGDSLVHRNEMLESNSRLPKESLYLMDPSNKNLLALDPFMIFEASRITNRRELHGIDHIQNQRYQFKAFRYPSVIHAAHDDRIPF